MAGYMYITGVFGEVTQGSRAEFAGPNGRKGAEFYNEWIELHSVTQTVTRAIETGRSGTARARAACVLEDIEIEKEVDQSSIELIKAVSGGQAFNEIMIHLCSASVDDPDKDPGQSLHPYLELHLFSVKVTSYVLNCSGLDDGSIPVETLNLNFDKVYWRYWPMGPMPQKRDARANEVHEQRSTGWDVIKATTVAPPRPGEK